MNEMNLEGHHVLPPGGCSEAPGTLYIPDSAARQIRSLPPERRLGYVALEVLKVLIQPLNGDDDGSGWYFPTFDNDEQDREATAKQHVETAFIIATEFHKKLSELYNKEFEKNREINEHIRQQLLKDQQARNEQRKHAPDPRGFPDLSPTPGVPSPGGV